MGGRGAPGWEGGPPKINVTTVIVTVTVKDGWVGVTTTGGFNLFLMILMILFFLI